MMEQCNVTNSRISAKSSFLSFLKSGDNEFETAQTQVISGCHEVGIPNTEKTTHTNITTDCDSSQK